MYAQGNIATHHAQTHAVTDVLQRRLPRLNGLQHRRCSAYNFERGCKRIEPLFLAFLRIQLHQRSGLRNQQV